LTFALLLASMLLARSFRNLSRISLGMDPEHVFIVTTDLEGEGLGPRQVADFYDQARERVTGIPGVRHAAVAVEIPFGRYRSTPIGLPGRGGTADFAPDLNVEWNAVSADFFSTLGTRLLRGRPIEASDDTPGAARVAVLGVTAANTFWPGQDPLGRCVEVGAGAPCSTVIGVVEDARTFGLDSLAPTLQVFVPLAQQDGDDGSRALLLQSEPTETLAGDVRRTLASILPNVPYVDVGSIAEALAPQTRPWRVGVSLFSLFAVIALGLAATGTFAAVHHAVLTRRHEHGVRMALGAAPDAIAREVIARGLFPVVCGLAVGAALAVVGGLALRSALFQVPPLDAMSWAFATATVLISAFLAALVPGLRAGRLDPARALRAD
jgi:hypothetical protein